MFRTYVKAQLSAIKLRKLHGIDLAPPNGFLRGIDFMGSDLIGGVAKSVGKFYDNHGMLPNLVEPSTFTEKQILFKFFGPIPQSCSPSDKLRSSAFAPLSVRPLFRLPARPYITQKSQLPANGEIADGTWYFKSNHGSRTNKRITYPLSGDDRMLLEQEAQRWLTKVHGKKMSLWWYEKMPRNIYLEQDLGELTGDVPDWKFFVFNGRVEIFQIDTDRYGDHVQTIYDRSGMFLNTTLYYKSGPPLPMPLDLGDMISIAEGIGKNFDFIRVDMFRHRGAIILGEIGLVPNGASGYIHDRALDRRLGAVWRAPWIGRVQAGYPGGHYSRMEMSEIPF